MLVNVKKVAKDIFHEDEDVRVLALTAVLHLSQDALGDRESLNLLIKSLEQVVKEEKGDLLFLARKGLNHLSVMESSVSSPSSSSRGEDLSRERLLAVLSKHDSDNHLASAISSLLKKGCQEDVEKVLPFLKHRDPRVRSNAIEFLERHASDELLLEHCLPLLQDENNRVKGTVATVLGRLGHPKVMDFLKRLLSDHRISVRESAVYALSNIRNSDCVDLLLSALRDPYEGIRLRAVKALARQKDPRALPALAEAMRDLDISVCEEAERAIAFIKMEEHSSIREGKVGKKEAKSSIGDSPLKKLSDLQGLGREIFYLRRDGDFDSDVFDKLFYEGVRILEFLEGHHYRAEEKAREGSSSLLESLPGDKPDPLESERRAIEGLEIKLVALFEEMGKMAIELYQEDKLDLSSKPALSKKLKSLEGEEMDQGC